MHFDSVVLRPTCLVIEPVTTSLFKNLENLKEFHSCHKNVRKLTKIRELTGSVGEKSRKLFVANFAVKCSSDSIEVTKMKMTQFAVVCEGKV